MRRRWWTVPVAALACAVAVAGCGSGSDAVNQRANTEKGFVAGDGTAVRYERGDREVAPDVSGELVDGERFRLRDARGEVVVINFWGSWCAPCRAEADDLQRVYESTKDSGVRFLGVNVRDSRDKAKAFERAQGVTYQSLFDPAGRVALSFRKTPPNAIPATVVIDRRGKVAAIFRKPLLEEDLKPVVQRVAAEK